MQSPFSRIQLVNSGGRKVQILPDETVGPGSVSVDTGPGGILECMDKMEEGPPVWQALWGLIGGKEGQESERTTDSAFSMDPSGKGVDEALEDLKRKQESSKQLVDLLKASRQKSPAGSKMTQLFQVGALLPSPSSLLPPPSSLLPPQHPPATHNQSKSKATDPPSLEGGLEVPGQVASPIPRLHATAETGNPLNLKTE